MTDMSASNLNLMKLESLIEKYKSDLSDEKQKTKTLKNRVRRFQQQIDSLRREISGMSDQKKLKSQFERMKQDRDNLDLKIDQMKVIRRKLEENKEDMRHLILSYQEHEQESELANQHLHEANLQLEDEKMVLKRQHTQTQIDNIELSHKYEKLVYEIKLKDQWIEKLQNQLKDSKKGMDAMKQRNTAENNPMVQKRIKEREKDLRDQMMGIQNKFHSTKQKQDELEEEVEKCHITVKDLKKKLRGEKKTVETLKKKLEDRGTEIFRLKKKIEDLLSDRSKHADLRMKHLEAERNYEKLKLQLDIEKSNREFDSKIIEQYRQEAKRNSQLQKQMAEMKERNDSEMRRIKEIYAKEKEKLNLDPLFMMLGRKEKVIQKNLGKVIKTIDAIESALRCMNCLEVYDQPRVCVPCGHVFCQTCIEKFEPFEDLRDIHSSSHQEMVKNLDVGNNKESKLLKCEECKKAVEKTVYIHTVDVISSKVVYTKRNVNACFKLSQKKVVPTEEVNKLKKKYQNFERELGSTDLF